MSDKIILTVDLEQITSCQHAVGLLMCSDMDLQKQEREEVGELLSLLAVIQAKVVEGCY